MSFFLQENVGLFSRCGRPVQGKKKLETITENFTRTREKVVPGSRTQLCSCPFPIPRLKMKKGKKIEAIYINLEEKEGKIMLIGDK